MRKCKTCKTEKEMRQFYKSGTSYFGSCMDCVRKRLNQKYAISKNKVSEEMNMITINLSEYRLTYFRISDNRKFLARRVSGQGYVLYDTVENKKVHKTNYFLKKEFVSDSDNFSRVKESVQLRVC